MPKLLMTLAVYDMERDLIQVPLSDFPHQTVLEWAQYFQNVLREYVPPGVTIAAPLTLRSTFYEGEQVYFVECTFHTWFSVARLLLGDLPL